MFWDICSGRPNVLGQDLIKEDNRSKKCFDKSETETEITRSMINNERPIFWTSPTERSNSDVIGHYDVTVTSINSGFWTSPQNRSLLIVRY